MFDWRQMMSLDPATQQKLQSMPMNQRVEGLLGNPMFNVGLGLMQHRANKNTSIPQAILGGIGGAQQQKLSMEERERMDKLRDELQKYFEAQGGQAPMPGMGPEMQKYLEQIQQGRTMYGLGGRQYAVG